MKRVCLLALAVILALAIPVAASAAQLPDNVPVHLQLTAPDVGAIDIAAVPVTVELCAYCASSLHFVGMTVSVTATGDMNFDYTDGVAVHRPGPLYIYGIVPALLTNRNTAPPTRAVQGYGTGGMLLRSQYRT